MDEAVAQEHDPTQLIDHLKSALTRPGARYGVLTEGLRDAIERGVLGPGDFFCLLSASFRISSVCHV